jgi:5-methylcytosine-specific restriction endonuclease McrA
VKKTRRNYPKNWPEIARLIKIRDGWRCQHCGLQFADGLKNVVDQNGKAQTLGVHHLDRNPMNNDSNNLTALCSRCHCKAEWPLIRAELKAKKYGSNKILI